MNSTIYQPKTTDSIQKLYISCPPKSNSFHPKYKWKEEIEKAVERGEESCVWQSEVSIRNIYNCMGGREEKRRENARGKERLHPKYKRKEEEREKEGRGMEKSCVWGRHNTEEQEE